MAVVVECLRDRMEGYTTNMESRVDEMTEDYFNEKKKGRAFVFVLLLDLVFFGSLGISTFKALCEHFDLRFLSLLSDISSCSL